MTRDDPLREPGAQEPPDDLLAGLLDLADEVVGRVTDEEVEAHLRRIQESRQRLAQGGTAGAGEPVAAGLRAETPKAAAIAGGEVTPAPPRDWPAATLLGQLPELARRALLSIGTFHEYADGEVLMQEGDSTTFVVLLLSGWVKVTAATENGGFALLAIGSAGDLVGEQAGLDGEPRSATVTAAGAVLAKVMPLEYFLALLRSHPDIGPPLLRAVSAKLRSSTRRRVEFGGCTIAMRLARVICELDRSYGVDATDGPGRRVQIAFTQPELAALVGAAEPTVHKDLRKLREEGVVDTRYRAIVIRDVEALYRAAGVRQHDLQPGNQPKAAGSALFNISSVEKEPLPSSTTT